MCDLFSASATLERIPVEDAEVFYLEQFLSPTAADLALNSLITETPWRNENVVVWGKTYPQPRLIAWYGDAGSTYSYSGIVLSPTPWTPLLLDLKRSAETIAGSPFNSVLLNYYRDNKDSMGYHSDDEPELGPQPIIASISLGAQRTFIMRHKKDKSLRPVRLKLASGSLLLMRSQTQANWKHGIEKQSGWMPPRVNLTFRRIYPIPTRLCQRP